MVQIIINFDLTIQSSSFNFNPSQFDIFCFNFVLHPILIIFSLTNPLFNSFFFLLVQVLLYVQFVSFLSLVSRFCPHSNDSYCRLEQSVAYSACFASSSSFTIYFLLHCFKFLFLDFNVSYHFVWFCLLQCFILLFQCDKYLLVELNWCRNSVYLRLFALFQCFIFFLHCFKFSHHFNCVSYSLCLFLPVLNVSFFLFHCKKFLLCELNSAAYFVCFATLPSFNDHSLYPLYLLLFYGF